MKTQTDKNTKSNTYLNRFLCRKDKTTSAFKCCVLYLYWTEEGILVCVLKNTCVININITFVLLLFLGLCLILTEPKLAHWCRASERLCQMLALSHSYLKCPTYGGCGSGIGEYRTFWIITDWGSSRLEKRKIKHVPREMIQGVGRAWEENKVNVISKGKYNGGHGVWCSIAGHENNSYWWWNQSVAPKREVGVGFVFSHFNKTVKIWDTAMHRLSSRQNEVQLSATVCASLISASADRRQ